MGGYRNAEISAAIDEWVHSQRDRALLRRRRIDGVTFERLAEEFDMSDRHVRRIYAKYKRKAPLDKYL